MILLYFHYTIKIIAAVPFLIYELAYYGHGNFIAYASSGNIESILFVS